MSEEFFIIAVPNESTAERTIAEVNRQLNNQSSATFHFPVPDLKVGTLDSLVALSDELTQFEAFIENLIRRLTQFFFHDILDDDQNRLIENLVIGHNNVDPIRYVTEFQWDLAKYPTKQPLKSLMEIITKATMHIENEFKHRSQAYHSLKQNLEVFEKRQNGNLLNRNLNDIVKKEHFVIGSEYLKTLIVCVPRNSLKDWLNKYETLCSMVVPRSSEIIFQDNDYAICTVTLFHKTEDTFRHKCRENKFVVRDFVYDEKSIGQEREKIENMENDRQKLYANLVRWLKINFAELFSSSIHIKAIRIFVESVLRYGLPVNFTAIVVRSNRKSVHRLHDSLSKLYGYLDHSAMLKTAEQIDIPGLFSSQQEYYPYVHLKLDLDFVEIKKK